MEKIVLIGPYPQPFGGVSTHLKRLSMLLQSAFEIVIIDESRIRKKNIFNIHSYNLFAYLKIIRQADFVHVNSGNRILRYFHVVISKLLGKKVIISYHSFRSKNFFLDVCINKLCYKIICVNDTIPMLLKVNENNIVVCEAFIPPDLHYEDELPADLISWMSSHHMDGKRIFVANAWRLISFEGEDLYGLDLCIEVAKRLVESSFEVAFVFLIGDSAGDIDVNQYKLRLKKYCLESNFFIYEGNVSFVKVIEKADYVLRPTNTDGDALSVREGLYFGKTVIASDVTTRPKNTVIFKNRSVSDFYSKIVFSFSNKPNFQQVPKDYLSVYKKIFS